MEEIISRRRQRVLYDEKWVKFLRRAFLFRWIPFVDFALAAGSMAIGNVKPQSDFDVLIGARSGRIFTARLFAALSFGLFGWRRKKLSHKEDAADKICLNHFVTEKAYRLSGPHDDYWRKLYQNLVPLFGNNGAINKFFSANADWLNQPAGGRLVAQSSLPRKDDLGMSESRVFVDDLRHDRSRPAFPRRIMERILGGRFGDRLEYLLRRWQIGRIERGLRNDPPGYKPRIIYGDSELEFHPDTRRIDLYLENTRGKI